MDKKELLKQAKKILKENWREGFTVPSSELYPHQWNWDSGFIAVGYSYYNQNKAQQELISLFEGQWRDGMLPQIIFRSKGDYFPGPAYWETELSSNTPENLRTSGITQPPVQAIAAHHIYQNAFDKENARDFLSEIFPKIFNFHHYLLTKRDPEDSGLITIFHPWESGLDNSVRWDGPLSRIEIDYEKLPNYERLDTKKIDPEQRPSNQDYDRYTYLIELMKKQNYQEDEFYKEFPFKVKDIVFSSILYVANNYLLEMAQILGEEEKEQTINSWLQKTEKNYFSYFCPNDTEDRLVYDYDLVAKERIKKRTASSLISLYTGLLDRDQAKNMVKWMKHSHTCSGHCKHNHPVITTTAEKEEKEINPLKYWRGPVWININWMLFMGLKDHGFPKEANDLRKAIIKLVEEHGFHEYYNPETGEGLGAKNFSWTAALFISFLMEDQINTKYYEH